jgi:predicted phage-related endonuclease
MEMEILQLAQGSPEWHEFRRNPVNHPASYAAVVRGRSPFMSRTELLDAYATGLWPEPSEFQQEIFAKGHRVEALYRPRAAEFLAQELYPVVGRRKVAGIYVSASMDGMWEDEEGNWECKQLNEELIAALPHPGWAGIEKNDARHLPPFYKDQMEQQCLVMGKERVLFVAADYADDGTLLDERLCWYESDPDLAAEIVAGWKQWDADLVTHKPVPKVAKVHAEAVEALPALWSRVEGQLVVTHNFTEWDKKLRAYIARLPKKPTTDQDFANLADAVKRLEQAEKELDAEENRALASLKPVNDMRTAKATLKEFSRTNRLAFNTLVETQKKLLRTEILMEHQNAYDAHIRETNTLLGAALLSTTTGTCPVAKIAEAMSGKKSINGWREGAAQAVADAKVKVSALVQMIQANQLAYKELATEDAHHALFRDLNDLLFKDREAFRIIVGGRISDWKAREEKRLADERAKIRAEEEARAAEKLRAEQTAAAAPAPTPAPTPVPPDRDVDVFSAPIARPTGALYVGSRSAPPERASLAGLAIAAVRLSPEPLPPAATGDGPTLTITQINARMGFVITAGFLEKVGITPTSTDGNAKRYLEADFPRICIAIRNHLLGLMAQKPEALEA